MIPAFIIELQTENNFQGHCTQKYFTAVALGELKSFTAIYQMLVGVC